MPEKRHEIEAERILAQILRQGAAISPQTCQLIAQALETAEKRGREISASMKESSG